MVFYVTITPQNVKHCMYIVKQHVVQPSAHRWVTLKALSRLFLRTSDPLTIQSRSSRILVLLGQHHLLCNVTGIRKEEGEKKTALYSQISCDPVCTERGQKQALTIFVVGCDTQPERLSERPRLTRPTEGGHDLGWKTKLL